MATVFYSWQDDLPQKINRRFIRNALDSAVSEVSKQFSLTEALTIDEDTSGKSGSPEIVSTILTKIDSCSMFVADLTLIGTLGKTPNPNVLVEYGYALKSLGPKRVVGVMNKAFGPPDSLPFDLRPRLCSILYDLAEDASSAVRSQQKRQLVTQFQEAFGIAAKEGILKLQSVYETRGLIVI